MGVLSDLRAVASLSRSLKRIADVAESISLQLGFKTLSQLREEAKLTDQEVRAREARDELGRPDPEDFERSELDLAFDQLRERLKRGEHVDDTELLAAAHALAEREGRSDTDDAAY